MRKPAKGKGDLRVTQSIATTGVDCSVDMNLNLEETQCLKIRLTSTSKPTVLPVEGCHPLPGFDTFSP